MTTDREFAEWLRSLRPVEDGEPDYTENDSDDLTPSERRSEALSVPHYGTSAH